MLKEIYIQKNSAIHRLDFWVKIISLLIILPLVSFIAKPVYLFFPCMLFATLLFFSKIGFNKFWIQSRNYLIPVTIGLLIMSLIFTFGNLTFRIIEGLILTVRFSLLISYGMLFSMITNPIEIPAGFLRAKIPHKYGVTLMVGYRMMPLLTSKISKIVQAQKARGASFNFSLRKPYKFFFQIGSLIVPLLHSTLDMSVKLSDALISRGYDPNGKITIPNKNWGFLDFSLLTISILLLIIPLFTAIF